MGRPCIRALLVALVCVMTLVSTSWGRSRSSNSIRRGHPNDRLRMATLASTRLYVIPVILNSYTPFGLIIRTTSGTPAGTNVNSRTKQAAGTQKPATGGK